MPRRKQMSPMQRIDSGEVMEFKYNAPPAMKHPPHTNGNINSMPIANGKAKTPTKQIDFSPMRSAPDPPQPVPAQPSILSLIICVSGIYASFLTWGLLQERITTTPYQPLPETIRSIPPGDPAVEYFKYPIVINTIQALFAFISGSTYLLTTTGTWKPVPSRSSIFPLTLVAITTTLASPFGYASLSHVDYLTFILAKSCKLLPVMALHIILFGKRYPLSKYLIVLTVTAGVAIFTLYHPPKPGKSPTRNKTSYYGLSLLAINLLFDGLTNTCQDHIFKSPHRYGPVRGPQMMVSTNLIAFLLQTTYLLLTPLIPPTLLPTFIPQTATTDLSSSLSFITRHPSVLPNILGFCVAGAIGQLFIFATLERFSSLVLVTVTVTRKMLTMVLSVVWFGKRLSAMQWVGVGLVFGGVVLEGWLGQRAKSRGHGGSVRRKGSGGGNGSGSTKKKV